MEIFELEGREFIELNNLLKVTGFCESGGRAKIIIADAKVKVDGKVELRKRCKIRSEQMVEYGEQKVIVK